MVASQYVGCVVGIFCVFHEYVEGDIIPAIHFGGYNKKKIGIPKIIENINRFTNFVMQFKHLSMVTKSSVLQSLSCITLSPK